MSKEKSASKGLKLFGKIVIVLVILLAIIIGSICWYINDKLGKIQQIELNAEDLGISQQTTTQLSGYRNIALLGIDSRSENDYAEGNRSDCMIIASINNTTNDVKLASVYRDTYVKIEGHGLDKITHAYSYGGAQLALNTINTNFDLNISEFVTVNFGAVEEIVDALGGVSITVTTEEVPHIIGIKSAGTYNLTGEQALAYSRIRYATGGDYKRTERMRTVIEACLNKVKTKDVAELNSLADEILPKISTNIRSSEILSLIPQIAKFNITESIGWPYETKGITLDRWYGVPITLESNVTKLHQDLFSEQNYTISETVKEISDSIVSKTGYKN